MYACPEAPIIRKVGSYRYCTRRRANLHIDQPAFYPFELAPRRSHEGRKDLALRLDCRAVHSTRARTCA